MAALAINGLLRLGSEDEKLLSPENRTVILPVVPYGCETWSLTLRAKFITKKDPEASI